MSDTIICRFVDGIEGATLLDLNDLATYYYVEGSEFPLPKVLYDWVKNQFSHGQRLANWTLDNSTVKLRLCIKGISRQDTYDKLNTLLARLLNEGTLEIRMWGADSSVFYHTYPALPDLPDWGKKFIIDVNFITNVTLEIPVDAEVKTSSETLWLIPALGPNDSFERGNVNDFDDWTETVVAPGTVTADTTNYLDGSVGCKLLTTVGGTDVAAVTDSDFLAVNELHHHNLQAYAYEVSGAPALDVDLNCYDSLGRVPPYLVDELLMDGTVFIRDLITSTALTMTGTPTTATLLGATAPKISATEYTSCRIATPFTAGQALSIMLVVNTAWAGNDGVGHYLFSNNTNSQANANAITIYKDAGNNLVLTVCDSAANIKYRYGAVNATNWAAGTHIIIATIATDNTLTLKLDGVALTTSIGTSGRESSVLANTYFGTLGNGTAPLTGAILCAIWSRVLSAGEIAALSSLAAWSTLTSTLSLLSGYNPAAATTWLEALEIAGSPVIYPSTSGSSPKFPTGTTKVKRTIRNDATVASAITIDQLWFGDTEYIAGHKAQAAMGIIIPPGIAKGNLATLADVHILNPHSSGPWIGQNSGTTNTLFAVSVLDATHVWAVGAGGKILFYNGVSWAAQASGTTNTLHGVSALDATHVWAVGAGGIILFFNGTNWVAQASGTTNSLRGVSALDATHVWTVGDGGKILFFNGASWAAQTSGTTNILFGVSALDATHVWAVGVTGTILFFDGTTWVAQTSGTINTLWIVSALDATHVWAIGDGGTILFFDGTTWAAQTSGTTTTLRGVSALDATHVWAVGYGGTILFYNGTNWTAQTSGTANYLYSVSALDATHVWAVGYNGTILLGVVSMAPIPASNIIIGQSDNYSENWDPVLDAVGATLTNLYSRRLQKYRAMAAAATEVFRFNAKAHKGKHMIVAGVSFGAATAFDKLTLSYKLQTTGGTNITTQTTSGEIDCGDPNTKFIEAACLPAPRLKSLPVPSQGVSENAELANIDVVVTVTAHASLATTMWLDYLGLVPYGRSKVEVSDWAYNALIIDSRDLKRVLASLDGSLDTAQVYDATKQLGIPRFTADPNGMNLTIVCLDNVAGDYQATFIPDVKIVYNPTYLIVAS